MRLDGVPVRKSRQGGIFHFQRMSSVDLVGRTDQFVLECLAEDIVEVSVILVAGCADAAGFGTGEQGKNNFGC